MEENIQLFKKKASLVSAVLHEAGTVTDALDTAVALCLEKKACENMMPDTKRDGKRKIIAAPNLDDATYRYLSDRCREKEILLARDNIRQYPGGIEMGVTKMDCGIADTGTLVLNSDAEDTRLATMLCETHVAILDRAHIVPSALDSVGLLEGMVEAPSSYTAFITGASRTADIERVLAMGVHGPLELHIILTGDAS